MNIDNQMKKRIYRERGVVKRDNRRERREQEREEGGRGRERKGEEGRGMERDN